MNGFMLATVVCTSLFPAHKAIGAARDLGRSDHRPSPIPYLDQQAPYPDKSPSNDQTPHWYTSPEWWLVILGFPTLGFVGWQARETRRASEATSEAAAATLRQARYAKRQTTLLQASVDASMKAADAAQQNVEAFIKKERARLRVTLGKVDLKETPAYIPCTIEHFGPTSGWIVSAHWKIGFEEVPHSTFSVPLPLGLPKRTSTGKVEHGTLHVHKTGGPRFNEEEIAAMGEKRISLWCSGEIVYRDDFDYERITRWQYLYKPYQSYDGSSAFYWDKFGPAETNLET